MIGLSLRNILVTMSIVALLAVSVGIEGVLFAYSEGAANLGLVWGAKLTEYKLYLWPFLQVTNSNVVTGPENLFKDILDYPWKFLGDLGYWLFLSVIINLLPYISWSKSKGGSESKKKKTYRQPGGPAA